MSKGQQWLWMPGLRHLRQRWGWGQGTAAEAVLQQLQQGQQKPLKRRRQQWKKRERQLLPPCQERAVRLQQGRKMAVWSGSAPEAE